MSKPIDRTKQSNRICKNCRAWSWFKRCYEPRSPEYMEVRKPCNTCMLFEWSDDYRNDAKRKEPDDG